MAKRQPFVIDGHHFTTKEHLAEEIRRRMARYENTEPFTVDDEWFFFDLLKLHPSAATKIGCGLTNFHIIQNPVYPQSRTLMLTRTDGTVTDWSWRECLSPTPHHQKVRHACRVLLEPQMFALKVAFFDEHGEAVPCSLTGEPMTFTTAHVDHIAPLTFEALFTDFFRQEQRDLASVLLSSEGQDNHYQDTFADRELAQRWLAYHDRFARLRIISARANMRMGNKEWKHGHIECKS